MASADSRGGYGDWGGGFWVSDLHFFFLLPFLSCHFFFFGWVFPGGSARLGGKGRSVELRLVLKERTWLTKVLHRVFKTISV